MSAELRMNGDYPAFEHRLFDPGPPLDTLPVLQNAAREWARLADPCGSVVRISIHWAHGDTSTLPMPALQPRPAPPAPPVAVPLAAPAPPPPGWDVSGRVAKYNGIPFDGRGPSGVRIVGRKLHTLRPLVEASEPIKIADFNKSFQAADLEEGRVKAGQECDCEDGSIRWQVGDLRRALREAFPSFDGDRVHNIRGVGYTLMVR